MKSQHQLLVLLETQRLLSCAVHERIKEHDRDVNLTSTSTSTSAVYEHANKTGDSGRDYPL